MYQEAIGHFICVVREQPGLWLVLLVMLACSSLPCVTVRKGEHGLQKKRVDPQTERPPAPAVLLASPAPLRRFALQTQRAESGCRKRRGKGKISGLLVCGPAVTGPMMLVKEGKKKRRKRENKRNAAIRKPFSVWLVSSIRTSYEVVVLVAFLHQLLSATCVQLLRLERAFRQLRVTHTASTSHSQLSSFFCPFEV